MVNVDATWELAQLVRSLSMLAFASLSPSTGTRPRMRQRKPHPLHHQPMGPAGSESHSAGSLRHHHVAHSHQPTRPGHPRTWPLSRKAQTLLETGPLANVGSLFTVPSEVRWACLRVHVCACGVWKAFLQVCQDHTCSKSRRTFQKLFLEKC